jgi:hypothetical protein
VEDLADVVLDRLDRPPTSSARVLCSRMMLSACRLSSRTDQLTIWPMPFIRLRRGKFMSMANMP